MSLMFALSDVLHANTPAYWKLAKKSWKRRTLTLKVTANRPRRSRSRQQVEAVLLTARTSGPKSTSGSKKKSLSGGISLALMAGQRMCLKVQLCFPLFDLNSLVSLMSLPSKTRTLSTTRKMQRRAHRRLLPTGMYPAQAMTPAVTKAVGCPEVPALVIASGWMEFKRD